MVLLHALEHGVAPTRVSTDLDALVNVRAVANSIPTFVDALTAMGFVEDGISPENLAHRYRRERLTVDVLAPEGLGLRADLRTAPPSPGRTLQVPAGTQALERTESVPIVAGDRVGLVPRPSLLPFSCGEPPPFGHFGGYRSGRLYTSSPVTWTVALPRGSLRLVCGIRLSLQPRVRQPAIHANLMNMRG